MKLEVESGDIYIEDAWLWRRDASFVVALTLSEKHAGCELVTSGALQQFQLFVEPGKTLDSSGHDMLSMKSTLVTLNEPGWLIGVEVSRYTAIFTGVRSPFGSEDSGIEVEIIRVDVDDEK